MTLQIGDGATIAALKGVKTISNFRNCDVALGGQGAPLVPIGDKLMFSDYDLCLNLGGIANISTVNIDSTQINKGCDICFCNIALNFLAGKLGLDFDKNGQNAASGNVDNALLEKLNSQFIGKNKSLGIEIFEQNVKFLLNDENIVVEDKLRTMCEHISQILKNFISNIDTKKKDLSLLITGGGAKNTFLISLFKENLKNIKIVVPDQKIIDYKEALIFAFLGLLRLEEEANCLSSVTGASKNNIGGAIYLG
jgi:anhydro-N-acetylmuramic acid kinase